ncbi:MAG: hypothetical protein J0L82_11240 [Deltaproteobacteria bacterium]|jgi:hypothetical protein|nr:hypothetical protein [Deltaproteobacteria bacterium]
MKTSARTTNDMKILMAIVVSSVLALSSISARAQSIDGQTVLQTSNAIENEVSAMLKNFQRFQASYFANNGRYATSLKELAFSTPAVLKDYGALTIVATHPMGYMADFVFSITARSRGLTKDRISVSEFGIMGAPRYTTLSEARNEIINYVRAASTAQKAYITEFGYPSTDLMMLGVRPIPHLYSLGQLKMEVVILPPSPPLTRVTFTWKATFTPAEVGAAGTHPPGSIGYLNGMALRPGPPSGSLCLDLMQVKIMGVTDLIYSIDHLGVIRTSQPASKCTY